ncbi:hypothetical protein [Mesobacillus foraminis]|uniref:Uncharacterized protein n=1 Tax=Mesobacillus foraminis TaxID=279826 RepID=A0A4R2BJK0_9BACI|nr:hypothetical protein [Mesobacillus foraminis]MBT2759115.1 hypothetical protein [Mesobacillus foraminis]TCN26154.1 hypothetical protein EV146_104262 [Mesobacillus foraminis]
MCDRRILTEDEIRKLQELKTVLLNADSLTERNIMLKKIEQLFSKSKQRHKFMVTLNED